MKKEPVEKNNELLRRAREERGWTCPRDTQRGCSKLAAKKKKDL